jgi:hypothetical protein
LPSMALEKDTNHWGRLPSSGRLTSKEAEPWLWCYAPCARLQGRHYTRQMDHTWPDLCNTCTSQPSLPLTS